MKIYQVEELVGITRKNIRFYEEQGLLSPGRNPENGYRDYSLADVRLLEKIKLLRKLSVPIEEIRLLEQGKLDLPESLERQIGRLEKEQQAAELMKDFCTKIKAGAAGLDALDAASYLQEIKEHEKGGTVFLDIEKEDVERKKKSGALLAAAVVCALMLLGLAGTVLACITEPDALIPMLVVALTIVCAIAGTIFAVIQRIQEINKGEEYEARKY